MIHVNLLPEEFRRKARTPIKVTLAVAAAAGVNAMLVAWYAWLALGVMAEVDSERDVLQTELDGLKPQLAYHKSLGDEQKSFAAREVTLAAITLSRINWTKKLDELVTVINSGGEGERHFVWLDDLNVSQTSDPRSKSAGSVRAAGHSGSEKFDQIANFLEDLEKSPFIEAFEPPSAPEGSQSNVDEELIPPVVWSFPLQLNLKSFETRLGEMAGAKAQTKPGAAPTKPGAAPAAPAETAPAPAPAPVEGQPPAATTPGAKEDKP